MENLIKTLKTLGKLVVIVFITVISFFGTAIVSGILQGLFGINVTFGIAVVIILMITIGTSILVFRKKRDHSIFIKSWQEEEQEEEYNHIQSEESKIDNVEEEYVKYFGF